MQTQSTITPPITAAHDAPLWMSLESEWKTLAKSASPTTSNTVKPARKGRAPRKSKAAE